MKHLIAIALLACACGSKETAKSDKAATSAGSASAGSGSAVQKVDEADLFTGSTVTLPTPAAKLKFGMPEADAKAAAPELFAGTNNIYEVPGTEVNYTSTKIVVQIERGKVWNIRAELHASQADAKAFLSKKWGEPAEQKESSGKTVYVWSSSASGMKAKLKEDGANSIIYFSQLMPRDQLLGSDPKHLGFDAPPLIGMTKADAMKALAAYDPHPSDSDPDLIQASFPATESAELGSSLNLRVKNDKVTGYTFSYVAGDAKDVDAFTAKLESIYGKGKPDRGMYTD
jgi:hypothetical protein